MHNRNRRRNWGITHSLTPKIHSKLEIDWDNNHIPDLPQKKKTYDSSPKDISPKKQRTKKHRLLQQRNTQIQKNNLRLYEKIRKIMLKGKTAQKKNPNQNQIKNNSQVIKPLILPAVSTQLLSTKTQLTGILSDRNGFAQKYFRQLQNDHKQLVKIHTEQIGNYLCHGWKVKVLLLDHGQFIVLKGIKGTKKKRQITKKYNYQRIKIKMKKGLQEWVKQRFQFQI